MQKSNDKEMCVDLLCSAARALESAGLTVQTEVETI